MTSAGSAGLRQDSTTGIYFSTHILRIQMYAFRYVECIFIQLVLLCTIVGLVFKLQEIRKVIFQKYVRMAE